jgi:hypothetical protein
MAPAPQQSLRSAELPTCFLSYAIDARLQEDGRTVEATMEVRWRNSTSVATDELLWHVYNNAWANADSVWLLEAQRHGDSQLPRQWGETTVEDIQLQGIWQSENEPESIVSRPQTLVWEYLPQPGAPLDRTVARVQLPTPVEPGASALISVKFRATLPRAFHSSGWGGGGFLHAAQWFPKLGVYETRAGSTAWNCQPYRHLGEFYADFADYEVNLTLPARYKNKLVATGTIRNPDPVANADGSFTYFTSAPAVHDFGWTVDPEAIFMEREFRAEDYQDSEEEQRVAKALGQPIETLRPTSTRMILLLQPEHEHLADRYFEAIGKGLYYFGLWYGSYPYETISCVDPANDARQIGHMEFPRLIVGAARLGRADFNLSQEILTVHEFGHQFWSGLVANDEFQNGWLDEGFSSFSTQRLINLAYPPQLESYKVFGKEYAGLTPLSRPGSSEGGLRAHLALQPWETPGFSVLPMLSLRLLPRDQLVDFMAELPPLTYFPRVTGDLVMEERERLGTPWHRAMAFPTSELENREQLRINAYSRPAMTLETMARLIGEARWTAVIRAYHQRFRFQHPGPHDFISVVQELASDTALEGVNGSVPVSWAAFWQAAYLGTEELDFRLEHFSSEPSADGDGTFAVRVELARNSDFFVPVEVDVEWEDGTTTRLVWDGADWQWSYAWQHSAQPAVRVEIDPERRYILDRDWLNNARGQTARKDLSFDYVVQLMLWTQQFLQFHGGGG